MSGSSLAEAYREIERELISFLARRLKSVFTAQDLAQEIYLKVHSLEDIGPVRDRRAYLFRMAANLSTDHLRKEARRAQLLAEARDFLWQEHEAPTPEQTAIAAQELARLEKALAELAPLSRRIFYLSRFEGRNQRDIAGLVGISPTAVFKHLRKVVDHLAKVREP
jgi:RNA polymerase sigma-70 factor (ECF subfamily)